MRVVRFPVLVFCILTLVFAAYWTVRARSEGLGEEFAASLDASLDRPYIKFVIFLVTTNELEPLLVVTLRPVLAVAVVDVVLLKLELMLEVEVVVAVEPLPLLVLGES